MNNTFQSALFFIIIFTLTYFLFVYPFEIINEFIFFEKEERRVSFLYTLVISAILVLYYLFQCFQYRLFKRLTFLGYSARIFFLVVAIPLSKRPSFIAC